MTRRYFLEIGVEELPARFIDDALIQLKNNFENTLNDNRIKYNTIVTFQSPRRLAIDVIGLESRGESEEVIIKGPAKRIAFDEDNNPTKALEGFIKAQNVKLEDIYFETINNEEYIFTKKINEGKQLEDVLRENIASNIKSISFPKAMRWGGKNIKFARPIRWIVSLLDDEIMEFDFEGIPVSNITRGHRFLGSQNIVIKEIEQYKELMRKNYVIVDPQERKDIIKYNSQKIAREKGGNVLKDDDLLNEVTNLVEYPTPIMGRIKEEYLNLPFDVIVTPMRDHLRFFPCIDDKNRLLPYFITIRNGDDKFIDTVIKGNEKVLGARLEDAKFFYNEDIKYPLETYVEKLKRLTFQEKLGTMYDKTTRLQRLSGKIADYLEVGDETKKNILRASYLSKADLVTKIVTEFTELQGKMGMEYAEKSGENKIVSQAIYEQYLPRFSQDNLPKTTAGAVLSITDKLDSICGLFAIGIQPTGSQDPFALRRGALGIINIVIDKKLNVSLKDLIDFSLYIYIEENNLACDFNKVRSEIFDFFMARAKNMLTEQKIRHDVVDSIISTGTDNIYDIVIRADKITNWLKYEGAQKTIVSFDRLTALADKAISSNVVRNLLSVDELELYDAFNKIEDKVSTYINKKEYDKALNELGYLADPINKYLDNVMVMVDDDSIRNNRLALIKLIRDKSLNICDLSLIQV
ncbi:glycine--tRNA ligase subunit beta [Soehngenia longivitae]|uniref:Glycine--tRNA ligase beta subunit n=1 Tax=Soehngenia longivitae TaxID=2562294 RepID=A0A4Z0D3X1_9FIRM|nr:glycine--tRNA ligase subunit beta [Soehngenia longivitae]TFZ40065.1 glycine--tRNA ligase subunit beta [Soehngenia longivitae]